MDAELLRDEVRMAFGMGAGRVSLVGAGPGDPELLTLRAARRLADAQVLVYDHLVGAAILDLAPPAAERVYVGKESSNHSLPQEEISALLVERARRGLRVVRLKGGDPFVFGRGGEEMEVLRAAGIPVEVVPGITAAVGAAASTGIPLTHRDHARSVVFVTGHRKDDTADLDWPALARPQQTLVIYMGVGTLPVVAAKLMEHGLPAGTPVALVEHATLPAERVVTATLATVARAAAEAAIRPPALVVVGEVVSLYPGRVAAVAAGARSDA